MRPPFWKMAAPRKEDGRIPGGRVKLELTLSPGLQGRDLSVTQHMRHRYDTVCQNYKEGLSRLPQMKQKEGTEIRFSQLPEKMYPKNATPAEITQHSMDSSFALGELININYSGDPLAILGMVDGGSPTLHHPIFPGTAPTCTGAEVSAIPDGGLRIPARDQYSSVLNASDQYALVLISHDQYAHDQYALVLKAHDQYALVLRRFVQHAVVFKGDQYTGTSTLLLLKCQPPGGSGIHPWSVSPNEWLGEKDFTSNSTNGNKQLCNISLSEKSASFSDKIGHSQHSQAMAELQFSFVCFLLGNVYEGFEQWENLVNLVCRAETFSMQHPDLYSEVISVLYHQLAQLPALTVSLPAPIVDTLIKQSTAVPVTAVLCFTAGADSQCSEADGGGRDRYRNVLFSFLCTPSTNKDLRKKALRFRDHLTKRFQWDFEEEPLDCAPLVVQLPEGWENTINTDQTEHVEANVEIPFPS
ncbi:unnamed protein product [Ranitomeya imitator]|uniref:AAR2 C-terminal domain-containing protein n=1 Tax=Ranitomeya imitator TaxID=111125 RepID=A0ABN9KR12_9NEOB|nr:unnamed protein product [Ranitomeya imitator]